MGKKRFDSTQLLSRVGKGKSLVQCHKGEVIFTQGDTADGVFFVHSGRVKLTVVSTAGKEAVVALLEPHSFFGEGCLIGQARRLGVRRGSGREHDHAYRQERDAAIVVR